MNHPQLPEPPVLVLSLERADAHMTLTLFNASAETQTAVI
jgi:hypothetical protein